MPPRRNAPRRDRRYSPGATPSGQEPTAYRWAGGDWGLVQWEQTIGDLLSSAGYCCAAYGKWHVGEGRGRWPTDKGFTEWYGPPRTYDEALWPTDPWYMTRAAIRCQRCCPSSAAKQMSQKVNNSPSTSGATATTSISPKRTGSFGPR